MKRIFLTQEDVLQLRKEIVLNSIYFSDYENHWGIDTHLVCDFFDSFISFIDSEAKENGENLDAEKLFEKYDNDYYLTEWCGCFEGELPLYYDVYQFEVELYSSKGTLKYSLSVQCEEYEAEENALLQTFNLAFENTAYADGIWETEAIDLDENEEYDSVFDRGYEYFLKKSGYKLTAVAA